mgnify:CR=1 FL=1
MALKPMKPCAAPACGALVRGVRYCPKHEHLIKVVTRQHDERRESSTQRGYSYKWQQARKGFLAKHPLCAECGRQGRIAAATDLDHIIPHKGDKDAFWARSNWQALCHPCHSRKTATEDGGWGNTIKKGAEIA